MIFLFDIACHVAVYDLGLAALFKGCTLQIALFQGEKYILPSLSFTCPKLLMPYT